MMALFSAIELISQQFVFLSFLSLSIDKWIMIKFIYF